MGEIRVTHDSQHFQRVDNIGEINSNGLSNKKQKVDKEREKICIVTCTRNTAKNENKLRRRS